MNLRVSRDAGIISAPVSRTVASLGHEFIRSSTLYTVEAQVKQVTGQELLLALLSWYAGGVAILMEFVGLYGLLSYSVSTRTSEIGIRMALGASRSRVLRRILAEVLLLTLLGVSIGIPCALSGGRLVAGLLFGLDPADSLTLAAAALFVVAIGTGAGLLPARRASAIEPMTALRSDWRRASALSREEAVLAAHLTLKGGTRAPFSGNTNLQR